MLKEYLKKVINEEGYNNKTRLEQTDDFEEIADGMNELEFRQFISGQLNDALAWGEPLDSLKDWYFQHKETL